MHSDVLFNELTHYFSENGEQNLSWNVYMYYWYVLTLMPNL